MLAYKPTNLHGLRVVTREVGMEIRSREQFRFPRSKRKRIRRKWFKQSKNWRETVEYLAFRMGDTVYVHPVAFAMLRQRCKSETDSQ